MHDVKSYVEAECITLDGRTNGLYQQRIIEFEFCNARGVQV